MDTPIKSNGYYKYLIQTGWWKPSPNFTVGVFAQDILALSYKDAKYLMDFLYQGFPKSNLPQLQPVVEEIDEYSNTKPSLNIDLVNPN